MTGDGIYDPCME